jgi:DNA-directed RNA polymerase subunit beta
VETVILSKKEKARRNFSRIPEKLEIPDLLAIQKESFDWFLKEGLIDVFREVSPIYDFNENYYIEFLSYSTGEPKYSEIECKERGMTYSVPLRAKVRLVSKITGEMKEQEVYMGELPWMTDRGTFIINGTEKVIVNQLTRSPGVYFESQVDISGRLLFHSTLIPTRGVWLECETDANGVISFRIDNVKKTPITILLKAVCFETEAELLERFKPYETIIARTLDAEERHYTREESLLELLRRSNQGAPLNVDNAVRLLNNYFFDNKRYDLGKVGRYKLNRKLKENIPLDIRVLTTEDITNIAIYMAMLVELSERGENTNEYMDDIDHLGNRRVKRIGEMLHNQFRVGFSRMERMIKERMSLQSDMEKATPQMLINIRPLTAAIKEFFNSSQLCQFMDQTNPLAELTNKRRVSALGPGGLSRERAGFEVRDVHHTHYGRLCPIETPEGPNIGLINSLATYARVNELGFIETPYWRVENGRVTNEIVYLAADEEKEYRIAQANIALDEDGFILDEEVPCAYGGTFIMSPRESVQFMDVSSNQIVGVSTALIPFLEHDDASRALMGANMQRQAVPLIAPQAPIVGTGLEKIVTRYSGFLVTAKRAGRVKSVSADRVVVETDDGEEDVYRLLKFVRSNQSTCINNRVIVNKGDRVEVGDIIADGMAMEQGELALGRNVLVALMPWEGYNYEDAVLISERLVADDVYTSIHIEEYEIEARDTKVGPEEITREVPNVGEESLKNLDENGIVKIGSEVQAGDILVGKVSPKGETELTPEEKLLRAILGEKSREVRDTSLRLPPGERGVVVKTQIFSRENGDELPPGVLKAVKVYVAQKRKISIGDKLSGRHGNKGVIANILPIEDMPFLPDGTPVDVVLNPLGVPSRMNLGQIFEAHLGLIAHENGFIAETPIFNGATEMEIFDLLSELAKEFPGLDDKGKCILYDGRTGEPFESPVTVGYMYIMKLIHLVDDKIHARSTGPYSLVTQQPLGGKAQFGGQRFGEMEVWALEAYGASHTLQEMLTIKADDIDGRNEAYEAIIKGKKIQTPGIPESFKVLIRELRGLGLDVIIYDKSGQEIPIDETDEKGPYEIWNEFNINLEGMERDGDE